MHSKITYRQQYTRCGKQRCRRCRDSEGHGPYWYAYWSEKGRTISKYIGVHLPPEVIAAREANGDTAESIKRADETLASTDVEAVLRVYLLGQFRVERKVKQEWKLIDSRIWQRRRARALLGCLLSSPSRRLGREQVMEQLWPDLDIGVASNRLNGAVHELRQILEPDLARPANSQMLHLERDMLKLADNTLIWVDVEEFENLLKEVEAIDTNTNADKAENLLEEAETLYGGGYLIEELYSEWAAHRRDALQRRWVGLLLELANLRVRRGAFVSAIETLDRLRVADPTNETALQGLMRLLTEIDRRGEALQVYRQHREMMRREYESEPLPETKSLYESLRKGHLPLPQAETAPKPRAGTPPTTSNTKSQTAPTPQQFSFARPAFQLGRHNQSPLVGRNQEQYAMQQLLYAIETASPTSAMDVSTPTSSGVKQSHFLLLTGDSGIGKTRLAEELSSEANSRRWAVAWSRAYEQEGNIAYHSWIELLRTLLKGIPQDKMKQGAESVDIDIVQTLSPARLPLSLQLERLSMLLPEFSFYSPGSTRLSLSYEQERLYLWEAALGILSTLSEIHPLLLILDDLHWTDESSIELLTYLTHHLRGQRVLLVGTCRDSELSPSHKLRSLVGDLRREQAIVTLAIEPLSQSQIGALVSYLPPAMVESIQIQAAGNPFFAEELARYIETMAQHHHTRDDFSDGSFFAHGDGTNHTTTRRNSLLPDAVAALLERRLHRLSSECQALLGKAAVLGGSFDLQQLLPMAHDLSEDAVLDLLDEVLQEGLLTEEGTAAHITYHFWHPLIVSHLYERLSAARRAQLHRRAAESLKASQTPSVQGKVAGEIFNHLKKGGGDIQEIAFYAELAGNQAYSLTAYVEAHYYYLQAILAIVEMSIVEAITDQDIAHYLSAHLLAPSEAVTQNLPHLCRLLELTAYCNVILGRFEEARTLYECILSVRTSPLFQPHIQASFESAEQAQQQEAQVQALLWREIVLTWKAIGAYDKAHESCRKGKEVLRKAHITECTAWACLHLLTGDILRYQGSYQEGRRYLQEATTMLEKLINHRALPVFLPSTAHENTSTQMGRTSSLLTRTERALRGDPADLAYGYEQLGVIEASMGQASEAQRYMSIALKEYEQQKRVSEVVRVSGNLGAVYIIKGEHDEAKKILQRALDLAERSGDIPNMAFITGNLGDVTYRFGDLIGAEAWFKRSTALAERVNDREHISWCSVLLADVQRDLGYLCESATNLQRAVQVGRAIKNSRCIRFALVSLGDLRITEAIIACKLQSQDVELSEKQSATCQRLLQRAQSTLQRAIAQEGVEMETIIDGKLLLATIHFLRGDLTIAEQLALQTLHDAQQQETIRVIGRAQRLLGRILAEQGNYDDADKYFEMAQQIFREQELHLDYARTLHSYGIALMQRIDTVALQRPYSSRGLEYLREARTFFNTIHATIDFSWVDLALSRYATSRIGEGVS